LVVDDDADGRDSLADLLESNGYTVAKAPHGAAAIDELQAGFDPDLVITDLMMPVMSGWELHDALKGRLAWRGIPIIVLCGMSAGERGQLQVEDVFVKPADFPVLLQRIASLCGI
jgi:CheY-like chemotaxis protein